MVALIRTGPKTRRRSPFPVPGRLPLFGTYKSQALERSYFGLERVLGFKIPIILDFLSRNDWTTFASQPGNMRVAWAGKGRRIIFSFMTAIENESAGAGGSAFPTATGGKANFTACNNGLLNSIWDSLAGVGAFQSMDDIILRMNWEMEGGYFPGTAGSNTEATEWRRSWRHVVKHVKSVSTNKQYATKFQPWFNPTGVSGKLSGYNFWPGKVTFGSTGAPPDTWGLLGDWCKDGATGNYYEKVNNTKTSGSWVLRSGQVWANWPYIFEQPDDVALGDDGNPLVDANGNSYCWVDICGPEGYQQIFDSANDTIEKVWNNETYGSGFREPVQGGVNSRGLKYWGQYSAYHKKQFAIGECGCGYKVDFPASATHPVSQSIEVYGHGGPGDNSYHYEKLHQVATEFNALFLLSWDVPAGDFNCEYSRSERLTGVPTDDDFRGDKPMVAGKIIEIFGFPGTPIKAFDETNTPPTGINYAWTPGQVTVTDATNIVLNSVKFGDIVAKVTASPAGAKRVVWTSFFGGDGLGYGILSPGGLTDPDGTGSVFRANPEFYDRLRLRTPMSNGMTSSVYVMAMSEAGFYRGSKINITVNNQTGTFGQTNGNANLDCAANQLNLIAVTAPSPASGLVLPVRLQVKLGTNAAVGQKFRAVMFSKTGPTTRGNVVLRLSNEITLTSSDVPGTLKTISWEGGYKAGAYQLVPGAEYWVGLWGNSTCDLAVSDSGTLNTFRATSTYNGTAADDIVPTGSTTLTNTGSLALYAVVSYEY